MPGKTRTSWQTYPEDFYYSSYNQHSPPPMYMPSPRYPSMLSPNSRADAMSYPRASYHNGRMPSMASPTQRSSVDPIKIPRTIDVIGQGTQLTVKGHIDLLRYLPVHQVMHKELLETFRQKPGNYEGLYNQDSSSRAVVNDLGNGFMSITFTDDITQPELSEFLVSKGWIILTSHFAGDRIFEKWTNVIASKKVKGHKNSVARMPPRHY